MFFWGRERVGGLGRGLWYICEFEFRGAEMDRETRKKALALVDDGRTDGILGLLAGDGSCKTGAGNVMGGTWAGIADEGADLTLLMAACENGTPEMVGALLAAGQDPFERTRARGDDAFSWCAKWGSAESMRVLAGWAKGRGGWNPDMENGEGSTLAALATFYGDVGMLGVLLDLGADPRTKGGAGEDCWDVAGNAGPNDRSECLAALAIWRATKGFRGGFGM